MNGTESAWPIGSLVRSRDLSFDVGSFTGPEDAYVGHIRRFIEYLFESGGCGDSFDRLQLLPGRSRCWVCTKKVILSYL